VIQHPIHFSCICKHREFSDAAQKINAELLLNFFYTTQNVILVETSDANYKIPLKNVTIFVS